MSLFSRMFGGGGGSSAARQPPPQQRSAGVQDALGKLSSTIELLQKKSDHLDKKIHDELVMVKVRDGERTPRCAVAARSPPHALPRSIALSLL